MVERDAEKICRPKKIIVKEDKRNTHRNLWKYLNKYLICVCSFFVVHINLLLALLE